MTSPRPTQQWLAQLQTASLRIQSSDTIARSGRITKATGLVLEATGLRLPLGAACRIQVSESLDLWASAEVVGFDGDTIFLMPHHETMGLRSGALILPVEPVTESPVTLDGNARVQQPEPPALAQQLPIGDHLLGRVVDASGNALDNLGSLSIGPKASLNAKFINPLDRIPITQTMDVGVRAINGLLSVGRGQRMGLFAGSGVGKSVLLGMMARYTEADVIVVGLIGERGREVKEFIEQNLGEVGLKRAVVVAAPADVSPLLRLQGAVYATRIAEHFRDQGKHVLLIMDSLTRYAMAQREIALAIGEPPATKGYPPSVFNKLPTLVERAGNGVQSKNGEASGSITAFYTVLTEGDDQQDPIADSSRAILDGHVVLSRRLAESGHYPAIDVEASISRVMSAVVSPDHIKLVHRFKQIMSTYQRNRDLIAVGAYQRGNDPTIDDAIERFPWLETYLRQGVDTPVSFDQAVNELSAILGVNANV